MSVAVIVALGILMRVVERQEVARSRGHVRSIYRRA